MEGDWNPTMTESFSFITYRGGMLISFQDEHQSTWNPNLPLRDLFYVTGMLASLTRKANLYGRTLIQIPEPKFVVFYNGQEEKPDVTELRLSHAYEVQSGEPMLELVVRVLNINKGHNEELAKKSPTLYQYMQFVDLVREKQKTMAFPEAMEAAITECIRRGILREFLIKNRSEVLRMTIFEYDQEKHLQQEREEAEERGEERGIKIGEERGIKIGEERGEIRGREIQARSMSLELYRNGVSLETIAQAAQVSVEIVQQWIKTE